MTDLTRATLAGAQRENAPAHQEVNRSTSLVLGRPAKVIA